MKHKVRVSLLNAVDLTMSCPGREYQSPNRIHGEAALLVLEQGSTEDLGWKSDELSKKRRKRKSGVKVQDVDMDAESRLEESKVRE